MNAFARPGTLDEALAFLAEGERIIMSGGTDLYPGAGRNFDRPVLDISGIAGLTGITLEDGLRIGAGTTWTQLSEAELPLCCRALQQAARQIGGRQIQNVGTIGGNLCNASPAADGVPPLLALDASVEILGPSGKRNVPLTRFLLGPRQTALGKGEILTAVVIPPQALRGRSAFVKLGARAYLVISIAMVAARIDFDNDQVSEAAIGIGACSGVAVRLSAVEAALIGKGRRQILSAVDDGHIHAALRPITDVRATEKYRLDAASNLVRAAMSEALL